MVMIYIKAIRSGVCVCVCHKNTSLSAKDYVWEVSNDCHWPKLKMDHLLWTFLKRSKRSHQGEGGGVFGRRLHLWEKAKGGMGPSGDHDHVDDGDDAVEVYSCGLELQIWGNLVELAADQVSLRGQSSNFHTFQTFQIGTLSNVKIEMGDTYLKWR